MTSSAWYAPTKSKRALSVCVCACLPLTTTCFLAELCSSEWLVYVHEKDSSLANICLLFNIAQFDRIRPRPLYLLLAADATALSLARSLFHCYWRFSKISIHFCSLVMSVLIRCSHIHIHRNIYSKWLCAIDPQPSIIAVLHCSVIVSHHKISSLPQSNCFFLLLLFFFYIMAIYCAYSDCPCVECFCVFFFIFPEITHIKVITK